MNVSDFRALFEKCFSTLFDGSEEFDDAMRYACFGGGKRVRPVGVYLGAASVSAAPPLDEVLSLAGAIELVHSYSLVHDDLPAMDNDDYRRGRLTVHKKFGEAAAILVGDALLSRAAQVLASGAVQFGIKYAAAAAVMTKAAEDMVRGQVYDLAGMRTEEEFRKMYALKTGALIRAAFVAGATVAGADDKQIRLVAEYAEALGLGFQIADDLLDEGEENSLVAVIGAERGRKLLDECTERAVRCAGGLPFGEELAAFAEQLRLRKN